MAMKMSSPKNTPMLSVAAAWARIRYARPLGDSTEAILGRRLAIGAMSGRTICA